MSDTHSTPDFSDWVGRSEVLHDTASRSAAIGLGAVLDRPLAPEDSDRAQLSPLGHWLQFTPTAPMSDLGLDGHPQLGGFMPPLDLPRRMWAGSSLEFHSPITVGQPLTRTTTIESITPKQGSSGRLCFVALRHDVSADGALAIVDRQTIVYREAVSSEGGTAAQPPRQDSPAPDGWDWVRSRRPNEATLFRYSALTFNTHRIHYDHPYTTEVERYPGLVVHGPLLATYLVDGFLDAYPGEAIAKFKFSARAPLFAGEQFHIVGRTLADGSEELAAINPEGETAISAHVTRA